MEDAAAWANGGAPVGGGRYRPELLDKYVEDDFEPLVYVREPDDADEYNFFAGSRFRQLGATEGVEASLREMGIERPSHIQALTYGALSRGSGAGAAESGETPQNVLLADQAGSGKTPGVPPSPDAAPAGDGGDRRARQTRSTAPFGAVSDVGARRAGARGGASTRAGRSSVPLARHDGR